MRRILPFFFLAMMVSWGCQRNSPVATQAPTLATAEVAPTQVASAESPPPAVTPPPEETELETIPEEPASEAKEKPEPGDLELGETFFKNGKYQQAGNVFEDFYRKNPRSKDSDRALFYLGLSRTLATDSSRDPRQPEAAFRQLIKDFRNSIYFSQAKYILNLLDQADKLRLDIKERDERVKKLSEELQVLKEIDLQRRPSRPKE
jgi:hypothetical protein